MTGQSQQMPNILPPEVQQAWDEWCDSRIDSFIEPVLDALAGDAGTAIGQHTRKIVELLEIMMILATDNAFLCGRIDQITREFKHQNGIEHKVSRTERTIATTTEQHSSRVSKTLAIIDEVLSE